MNPRPNALPEPIDPKGYLLEILPALWAHGAPPRPEVVVQFLVIDRGDCDLIYHFDGAGLHVLGGVADRVDLTLAIRSDDLVAFARQELDVDRALRTRRLKVHGDLSLLPWMAERIAAGAPGVRP